MKRLAALTALLAAFLLAVGTAAGQSNPVSGQPAAPAPVLNESHKREILNYLDELKAVRKELELTQRFIVRNQEQDEREKQLAADRFKLLEDQRDRAKDEAQHYKVLYESLIKKRGKWCSVKRILNLGMARCK